MYEVQGVWLIFLELGGDCRAEWKVKEHIFHLITSAKWCVCNAYAIFRCRRMLAVEIRSKKISVHAVPMHVCALNFSTSQHQTFFRQTIGFSVWLLGVFSFRKVYESERMFFVSYAGAKIGKFEEKSLAKVDTFHCTASFHPSSRLRMQTRLVWGEWIQNSWIYDCETIEWIIKLLGFLSIWGHSGMSECNVKFGFKKPIRICSWNLV